MPLETPTPDGVLELFRDEIVPREADPAEGLEDLVRGRAGSEWDHPFPGVEMLAVPGGPTLMRVTYRRLLDGSADEGDRIRHELRQLWNDIRAAIPSDGQAVFVSPSMTHVDRPEGLEVICSTHGVVRAS